MGTPSIVLRPKEGRARAANEGEKTFARNASEERFFSFKVPGRMYGIGDVAAFAIGKLKLFRHQAAI
jgi:hypothetical protein